jgi:DNA-binding LytR/AlgR family response regulator
VTKSEPGRVTAIVADDEDLPRDELCRMLHKVWPALDVVARCEHGPAAVEAIDTLAPDVAFLDIRMPGRCGLDVARAASGRCHVVFTTAHDTHAVAAFEAGAVDYLLKPVSVQRLEQAVQRLQQRLSSVQPAMAPDLETIVAKLEERLRGSAPAVPRLRWISASVGETIKLFGIDQVLFFQSDEKYTRVVTAADEAHVRKPLKDIADGLDPEQFWQVHRGIIVRADAISRAQRDELGRITLQLHGHTERLPVSQAYAWRFRAM